MFDSNEINRLVKEYRNNLEQMENELAGIDTRLKPEIVKEEQAKIRKKHHEYQLQANNIMLDTRQQLEQARIKELDPMRAIFKAAYQRGNDAPGLPFLIDSLDVFDLDTMVDMASEFQHPALILKAYKILRNAKIEPGEWQGKTDKLHQASKKFIDVDQVKKLAGLELAVTQAELFAMDKLNSNDSARKLSLARRIDSLEKMIAEPDEKIAMDYVIDPTERLNQGHAA